MRIDPAVTFALGVPDDPVAVWNAAFRKLGSGLKQVINRAVDRLPTDVLDTPDDDSPKIKHRVKLRPTGSSVEELGLKFAVIAHKIPGGAQLLVDEGRRYALGQPRGPKVARKLDDPGDGRSLEGQIDDGGPAGRTLGITSDPFSSLDAPDVMDDGIWRAFGLPAAGGFIREMRSFEDENAAGLDGKEPKSLAPVIIAGIIGAVVSVLVVIVPIVLPMVLDAGGRFIQTLKDTGGDIGKAAEEVLKSTEQRQAEADAVTAEDDKANLTKTLLIAGGAIAAVIVVVVIARKMGGG